MSHEANLPHWGTIAQTIADYQGTRPPATWDETDDCDQFDVAEALACIAHDWGEYALLTYLEREIGFRPRPNLQTDTLEPLGAEIYNALNECFGVEIYGDKRWAAMKAAGAFETLPATGRDS